MDYIDCYLMHWPVAFQYQSDLSVTHPQVDGKFLFADIPPSGWKENIQFFLTLKH